MNNFSKFTWINNFVYSRELEQEVALAGTNDSLVIIDVFGNILETVNND